MYSKQKQLNTLEQKYSEKIEEADSLRGLSTRTTQIKKYAFNKDDMVKVLSMLYQVVPDQIYLKGITVDNEGKVFIKGTSKSMSRIFAFVTELENNNIFQEVKTEFTENRKEGGKDVADFGIVMSIERGKE